MRAALESLERSAPTRRSVRTLRATLAWVEHDRDGARAILDELVDQDPADSTPEREVGASLLELYRFSEALDFLERAVERDEQDYLAWTRLGEALANTGSVERGLEALQRARELAKGRHDVWRKNTRVVLERITSRFEELDAGGLQFAWSPAGSEVLATYLVPFYQDARRELALRYGYSSGPVRIEVFDRHEDFSVRSTGCQGFPALGVCFGPVVTAVSPLSELRGTFSWARTSYHEFT
ncbi:MAG: tetratricopeptide repeat protein, partial [Planctomycetota bacterium]